jgi:Leucine-rich repeat (LRR) protein
MFVKHQNLAACIFLSCILFVSNGLAQPKSATNAIDIRTNKGFCLKYKCTCPEPQTEIKCSFPSTVKSVDFIDPNVLKIDFSNNSLEMFVFGDTILKVKELLLAKNNIKKIHEDMFVKMPHLQYLDMSDNCISSLQAVAFQNLNILEYLNLSRSFDSSFQLTNELSTLVGLKVLDLSYSDMESFSLERTKISHLLELHLRYTKNADKSFSNWLPYIGTRVKLLDLTGSNIRTLDSSGSSNKIASSLLHLNLAGCVDLEKASLVDFIKTNKLFDQLKTLSIVGIGANSSNLPIENLILNANSSSLESLDISNNNYSIDLNVFLFNQPNLKNLVTFKASHNNFRICNKKLIAGKEATLLTKLEYLDLSYNQLESSSCLYSIKPVNTLRHLDLNHNKLQVLESDFKSDDLGMFFAEKLNLSYIDMSNNQIGFLTLYFNPRHARIEVFDLSHNKLKKFQILSWTLVESGKYPFNNKPVSASPTLVTKKTKEISGSREKVVLTEQDEEEEDDGDNYELNEQYYDDETEYETVIGSHAHDDLDDDLRFVFIQVLDLSHNLFETVNVQHMLQSVENVVVLDLSFNPLVQVVGKYQYHYYF